MSHARASASAMASDLPADPRERFDLRSHLRGIGAAGLSVLAAPPDPLQDRGNAKQAERQVEMPVRDIDPAGASAISPYVIREFWDSPAGVALLKRIPQRRLGVPSDLDGALLVGTL
jgi:hypothetical protein